MTDIVELPFTAQMVQRLAADEQATAKAKRVGHDLLMAVAEADPATLPPAVRDARERLLELGAST